jgi:hypothetical protein
MRTTISELYESIVAPLSSTNRLQLVTIILNVLVQQSFTLLGLIIATLGQIKLI